MNRLRLVGLSHRTAPVEWRERLAVSDDRLPAFLDSLRFMVGAGEAVLLSTCNRVEVYAVTPPEGEAECLLRKSLLALHGDVSLDGSLYALEDEGAIRHLFRVAAGLDSLVVGEAEILGQVKRSYDQARQAASTGKLTNVLFQRAMYVGKSVRTETKISEGPTSVPSLAVSLAHRIFGELSECHALVVGAGAMAELAVRALKSQKVGRVVVANRTLEKAVAMAQQFGAHPTTFDALSRELVLADIVICSTGAKGTIFNRAAVAQALEERRGRPLFFIDIAVPRDVDPSVDELENVYLYNIDDLEGLVSESLGRRESEIARAGQLVDAKANEFAPWYDAWRRGTTAALRHHVRESFSVEGDPG
ncbi:MAG: glutamyl-tRNA reductase [Elusimicrobia bacterium]|nr:glutamyl-tRNA reductase [Elusimicrobiota bacterium]